MNYIVSLSECIEYDKSRWHVVSVMIFKIPEHAPLAWDDNSVYCSTVHKVHLVMVTVLCSGKLGAYVHGKTTQWETWPCVVKRHTWHLRVIWHVIFFKKKKGKKVQLLTVNFYWIPYCLDCPDENNALNMSYMFP